MDRPPASLILPNIVSAVFRRLTAGPILHPATESQRAKVSMESLLAWGVFLYIHVLDIYIYIYLFEFARNCAL